MGELDMLGQRKIKCSAAEPMHSSGQPLATLVERPPKRSHKLNVTSERLDAIAMPSRNK